MLELASRLVATTPAAAFGSGAMILVGRLAARSRVAAGLAHLVKVRANERGGSVGAAGERKLHTSLRYYV